MFEMLLGEIAVVMLNLLQHGDERVSLAAIPIQDIRQCLGLISLRERELADLAGAASERPYFTDEEPAARVVPIGKIGKAPPKGGAE
jgi:hypothetical protein